MAAFRLVLALAALVAAAAAPETRPCAETGGDRARPATSAAPAFGLRALDDRPAAAATTLAPSLPLRPSVASPHGVRLPVRTLPSGAPPVPRAFPAPPDLRVWLPIPHADVRAAGPSAPAPSGPRAPPLAVPA
jgi:hypothetical protein